VTVTRFERRHQKLAPRRVFWHRQRVFLALAVGGMIGWVAIGTVLFHLTLDERAWVDAFLHASLLASGMGPAPDLHPTGFWGKVFEAGYSLVSGFVLLASAGVAASPIVHRIFHHFHVDDTGG
jgi:hypothetical protein